METKACSHSLTHNSASTFCMILITCRNSLFSCALNWRCLEAAYKTVTVMLPEWRLQSKLRPLVAWCCYLCRCFFYLQIQSETWEESDWSNYPVEEHRYDQCDGCTDMMVAMTEKRQGQSARSRILIPNKEINISFHFSQGRLLLIFIVEAINCTETKILLWNHILRHGHKKQKYSLKK